jgi:hypothetical protein
MESSVLGGVSNHERKGLSQNLNEAQLALKTKKHPKLVMGCFRGFAFTRDYTISLLPFREKEGKARKHPHCASKSL